jgi:hypothetical protein
MYIVLVSLAVIGMLPLAIILFKRYRIKKIEMTGMHAKARVYEIRTTQSEPRDLVCYFFHAGSSSQQYTGILTSAVGAFKKGQTVDVFYLPDNPKKHAVKGAWKSSALIVFGIAIALFFLFVDFKLYQMIRSGEI